MTTRFSHSTPGATTRQWDPSLDGVRTLPWAELATQRIAVVAPHPDDETLGAGGLIAGACTAGLSVTIVSCTDGEAAYGEDGSEAAALGRRRRIELDDAADRLTGSSGNHPAVIHAGLPDGRLAQHTDELTWLIEGVAANVDLLVAPWPGDGHPDHEAVGEVCRAVVDRTGIGLLEYPVWMWHWGTPTTIEGLDLVALPLTATQREHKRRAVQAHASQVGGPVGESDASPILSEAVLAHFDRDVEIFVDRRSSDRSDDLAVSPSSAEFFDAMYAAAPGHDPWDFGASPAERARYDAIVDALSDRSYATCFEPGCSVGELTSRLVDVSRRVVAMDFAPHAIDEARRRHGHDPRIEFRCGALPDDLPHDTAPFDLIVLSEIGYYFDADRLGSLVAALIPLLADSGRLLAAHWTGTSADHVLSAETTHDVIQATVPWASSGLDHRGSFVLETWDRP